MAGISRLDIKRLDYLLAGEFKFGLKALLR
jgi:hypothetical protein